MSDAPLRSWAEIDLAAIRHNLEAARAHVGESVAAMAVVKANAYGHGALRVAEALKDRAEMFGVANLTEALELSEIIAPARIFILGPALPDERQPIAAAGFIPTISSVEEAAAFGALAPAGAKVPLHLSIDTGMGRIGIWQDEAIATARAISQLRGVELAGIASHLPVADEDDAFTRAELAQFQALVAELRSANICCPAHIENSAGLIGFPAGVGDMFRAGLMLYGVAPRAEFQPRLRAALTWKARITLVRDVPAGRGVSYGRTFITPRPMRIATIGAGYADGIRRTLSGRGAQVLIGGHRCDILGRVTMDQILADVSAVPSASEGDEVVLLGAQGAEEITAVELAQKAGTIAWEIFTGIGQRVRRLYR